MYADYEYYRDIYRGKMTEAEYTPHAKRAEAYISSKTDHIFERKGMPAEGTSLAGRLKDCACALADEFSRIEAGTDREKTSERVGDLAVSYSASQSKTRDERLWDILQTYIPDAAKAVRWV